MAQAKRSRRKHLQPELRSCAQLYNPMAALHGGGLLGLYDQQPGLSRGDEGAASGRQEHAGIGKGSGCATEAHQGQR